MNRVLAAALKYHNAGFHVVPLEARGKRPLVSWKAYQERQPTSEELQTWFANSPGVNVGLVLGRGTFAVDCDSESAWAAIRPYVPDAAPLSKTAKGWHALLRGTVPDSVGILPGVDVRGVGYICVAPSVHPSGAAYAWVREPESAASLPVAPSALLALLAKQPRSEHEAQTDDPILAWANGVAEGGRDVACTRAAGKLLGLGLHPEAVEALLLPGAERCEPPFDAGLVAKCVASIAKREDGTAPSGPPADIKVAVAEAMAEINTPAALRRLQGTEFTKLDEYLSGGFEPGELAVNGAPPGTGKTAFLLQIARRKAEDGVGILFVTREMRRAALVRRWLVQVSGVRMSDVKSGQLVDQQRASLKWAAEHLAALPIWISGAATVEDIRAAMALFEPGQVGLVFVDYLQLLRGGPGKEKRVEVGQVSQALKDMAIDFSVPVVCNSSLRRLSKMKDGSREKPEMSDLRESGEIEFGADIVTIMTRAFDSDVCDLVVAKNRDGRTGTIKLRFQGDLMRFTEMAA